LVLSGSKSYGMWMADDCLIHGVQNIKSEFRKSLYGVLVITFSGIFTYIIVNNKKILPKWITWYDQ